MRPTFAFVPPLAVFPLLAGCAVTDPLSAPGLWNPNGANQANLVASVANPADLVRGRSDWVADPTAVTAVMRYRAGNPKPLPASGLAEIRLTPSGNTDDAGQAGGAGTGSDGSVGDGR